MLPKKEDAAYAASQEAHKSAIARGSIERGVPYHEWVNGSVLFSAALTREILTDYEYVDVSLAVEAVNEWWKQKSGYAGLSLALTNDDKGNLVFVLTLRK